jgi:hypothetical protein
LNYDLRLFQGLKPPTSYIFIFFGGLEMQKSTFFFSASLGQKQAEKNGRFTEVQAGRLPGLCWFPWMPRLKNDEIYVF